MSSLPVFMSSGDSGKQELANTTEALPVFMSEGYDPAATRIRTRQSLNISPDIAAQDMRLAEEFGEPADIVSRNRDAFLNRQKEQFVQQGLENAPVVRGMYNESNTNAALLRDDLDNATGLEKLFDARQQTALNGLYGGEEASISTASKKDWQPQGFLDRLPIVAREGARDVGYNVLSFINAISENVSLDPNAKNYVEGTARDEDATWRTVKSYLQEQKEDIDATRLQPTGNDVQDFAENVVRMGPQVASQVAAFVAGGWAPSLLFAGAQIAGSQYAQLTEDTDIDSGRALLASLANAGLQAPLETIGTGTFLKVFKASGLGNIAKAGFGAMAAEFVTEWAQAYPESLTSLWAEAEARGRDGGDTLNVFFDRLGETTKQGMYEGAVASVYGLLGGSGKMLYEYGRYKTGKADSDFFAALDESAQGSKTRVRLPKAYQNVVEAVTADGPVSHVYVSPQAMREAMGTDVRDDAAFYQLAETLGLTREHVDRAEALGADVEIPLPLYQTHIAGTDISLGIRDSVKFNPDDMSIAERLRFEQEIPEQLAATLRAVEADARQNAELDTALAPIAESLGTLYGKQATAANVDLLKARAKIAAAWWTEAGEALTPAQIITDKWGLGVEVVGTDEVAANADLLQAMNKSTAVSIDDFMAEAREGGIVFRVEEQEPEAARKTLGIDDLVVNIPYDFVQHLDNKRPNAASALVRGVGNVLASADDITETGKDRRGNPVYSAVKYHGDVAEVVVFSLKKSTKKGNRAVPITAFVDKASAVNYVLCQRNRAATSTGVGGASNLPKPLNEDESRVLAALDENILYSAGTVNASPRGLIQFSDAGATIKLFRDSADLSTFSHEAAHLFINDMEQLVATGTAPPAVVHDLATLQSFTAEFSDPHTLKTFYDKEFSPSRQSFAGREFSDLSVEELTTIQHVAGQEKIANAFLTYLQEGKAPSVNLRNAFRRMRDWLKGIYQYAMGNVQINPEIRGVFDRMLATDTEITLAEEMHRQDAANLHAINAVATEMLTDAEQVRLKELRENAAEESRAQRLGKSLTAYTDSLLGRKELKQQVTSAVDALPVYKNINMIRERGGISRSGLVELVGKVRTKELTSLHRGLVKQGGSDPEYAFAVADYASVDAMLDDFMQAVPKKNRITADVQRIIAAREIALRESLGLEKSTAGEEDYYNDSRLKSLLLEMRALERKVGNTRKSTAGTASINRQWAQDILGTMPVREAMNVGRHAAAEAKSAAESSRALTEGRMEDAASFKRKQAINHAMVLEALKLRNKQQVFDRALKRYAKSKTMTFAWQEQILALAQRYSLGGTVRKGVSRYAPRKPEERPSLRTFVDEAMQDTVFGPPPMDDFILNETVPENMTMAQLEDVWNTAKWMASEGSPGEAVLITEGTQGSVLDAAKEGAEILCNSGNVAKVHEEGTISRSATDKWRSIFAHLNEFKDQMMKADGYQEIGTKGSHNKGFHSMWHQRIMNAHNAMSQIYVDEIRPEARRIEHIRDGFIRRFTKTLGKRTPKINGIATPENMQAIGRSAWTAEHIWTLARNMGNAGNLKTLTKGYNLSMEQLMGLTSILSAEEWQAIQAEGNLLGRYYERTDKVFRDVYGRPMPDKVQPQELTVRTAEGKSLTLPGWYFPISVDTKLDVDIADKKQAEVLHGDPNFTAYGPSLSRGHTKSRTGTSKPVGLYFGVFERALSDQLRFMTHAPVIRDFDRITRTPEWRKEYVAAFGQQAYDQLRPTIKYLVRPAPDMSGTLDGFFARQRQLATLFILGHNTKTFLRQFQGFFQAAPELGGAWEVMGAGQVVRNPLAAYKNINSLSPFMQDRAKGFDRDQREALNAYKALVKVRVGGKTYTDNDLRQFTMSIVRAGDIMTSYSIWQGAYMKAQQKLDMDTKAAVQFADSIIQKTQASATPIDLTPIQREGGVWRLFTMFMGESLRKGSRMRYWWGALQAGKIDIGQYAHHLAMETIVPALYFVGLVGLLSDDEPDKKDVAAALFSEAIGPIPFMSSIAGAAQYNRPLTQSTVFTGVESMFKAGKNIYNVFDNPNDPVAWSNFYKSSIDVAAYFSGVGNVRLLYETGAEGWEELNMGHTHNPFRLFFRKPRD